MCVIFSECMFHTHFNDKNNIIFIYLKVQCAVFSGI